MEGNIADVRCRECGAPAKYNIIRQQYLCSYCGGKTEVSEAIAAKKGFRSVIQSKIKNSVSQAHLLTILNSGAPTGAFFAFCGIGMIKRIRYNNQAIG